MAVFLIIFFTFIELNFLLNGGLIEFRASLFVIFTKKSRICRQQDSRGQPVFDYASSLSNLRGATNYLVTIVVVLNGLLLLWLLVLL